MALQRGLEPDVDVRRDRFRTAHLRERRVPIGVDLLDPDLSRRRADGGTSPRRCPTWHPRRHAARSGAEARGPPSARAARRRPERGRSARSSPGGSPGRSACGGPGSPPGGMPASIRFSPAGSIAPPNRLRTLKPLSVGRVVRGGDVDRAGGLVVPHGVGDRRRGGGTLGQQHSQAVASQDLGCGRGKVLGAEPLVVPDDDQAAVALGFQQVARRNRARSGGRSRRCSHPRSGRASRRCRR